MANPDFTRFSLGPYTYEQTQGVSAEISFLESGWFAFAVRGDFRANNDLVGYCGFLHHEVDGKDESEIGYRLHPDYWNRGLASEAAQAVPRSRGSADLNLPQGHFADSS